MNAIPAIISEVNFKKQHKKCHEWKDEAGDKDRRMNIAANGPEKSNNVKPEGVGKSLDPLSQIIYRPAAGQQILNMPQGDKGIFRHPGIAEDEHKPQN